MNRTPQEGLAGCVWGSDTSCTVARHSKQQKPTCTTAYPAPLQVLDSRAAFGRCHKSKGEAIWAHTTATWPPSAAHSESKDNSSQLSSWCS